MTWICWEDSMKIHWFITFPPVTLTVEFKPTMITIYAVEPEISNFYNFFIPHILALAVCVLAPQTQNPFIF